LCPHSVSAPLTTPCNFSFWGLGPFPRDNPTSIFVPLSSFSSSYCSGSSVLGRTSFLPVFSSSIAGPVGVDVAPLCCKRFGLPAFPARSLLWSPGFCFFLLLPFGCLNPRLTSPKSLFLALPLGWVPCFGGFQPFWFLFGSRGTPALGVRFFFWFSKAL